MVLTCGKPGSYCVIQLEDTLAPALVYLPQGKAVYQLPQGEGRQVYSPRAFSPGTSVVRARLAQPSEVEGLRNLALNPYDGHENKDMFPHAFANVETRGEAVFAARNAIDGLYENSSHGGWPYTSWGINRDPQAAWTIDFGRTVLVEKLRITLRADFPPRRLVDPGDRHLFRRFQPGSGLYENGSSARIPGLPPAGALHHLPRLDQSG